MKKFIVAGDLNATFFTREMRVNDFIDSYQNKLFYSRTLFNVTACIRELDKKQSPPNNLNPLRLHNQIDKLIKEYNPMYIVLCLGQFDIEFDYYYRNIIEGKNNDFFLNELIEIYKAYILKLYQEYGVKTIIKGLNPSVLIHEQTSSYYVSQKITTYYGCGDKTKDYDLFMKVIHGVRSPESKFARRFQLIEEFNLSLQELAKEMKISYFNVWDKLIDKETNMVELQFMPAKETHYIIDSFITRKVHYDALYEVISKC
ncbi:hypothetical protein [Gallibacterium anatis]|uniref:SGNH hydrolase-type esterase domain-containing protein n=1 Tax=Gallibacterium anatis TaxID=750 RepID=A0A0A2X859_9PAST|nr:hypothetical protein [Gallibacterium anatis]KGQ28248.1 hypothetical protein JP32_12065 [Gallibacterium anatis]